MNLMITTNKKPIIDIKKRKKKKSNPNKTLKKAINVQEKRCRKEPKTTKTTRKHLTST